MSKPKFYNCIRTQGIDELVFLEPEQMVEVAKVRLRRSVLNMLKAIDHEYFDAPLHFTDLYELGMLHATIRKDFFS